GAALLMSMEAQYPYVVYSTLDGSVGERRSLRAIDYDGAPLGVADLIPLPDGATLSMLPQRLAVGLNPQGERVTVSAQRGWPLCPFAHLPPHLPAYKKPPEPPPFPFFGYTAIAVYRGRLSAAALRPDNPERCPPRNYDRRRLERLVRERLAAEPENRVLAHHA